TEFAVLGALFFTDFYLFDVRRTRCVILGFLSGAAAAVFDEIHQIFVPGRAGMITDVLLDFAGVVTGCLLVFAVTLCFTAAVTRRPPKAVQ
ncbi:MAG: VanZ family protein, partial [Clostridia bacterium]|nr:VanZ family protein [Clostridia bacterium]